MQFYVQLDNFPEIDFTSSEFNVIITSCTNDEYASFKWTDDSTEIAQFDYVINDGTHDIDFITGSNILASSCSTYYFLHKEGTGGVFTEYTGTEVSFDSGFTKA